MSVPPGNPRCDLLAETPRGPLRLTVPPASQTGRACVDHVDIAQALARCEPLVCALEDWLGCALDPHPVSSALPRVPGGSAVVLDSGLAPKGSVIHLPSDVLLQAPPPPPSLAGLTWPLLICELELARYEEAPATRFELQEGRLLLLPQAFESPWRVRLNALVQGLAFEAHCSLADGHLQAMRPLPPEIACRSDTHWRVVLGAPIELPLASALGWHGTAGVTLPIALPAGLLAPGERLPCARGSVFSAWDGAALHLAADSSNQEIQ